MSVERVDITIGESLDENLSRIMSMSKENLTSFAYGSINHLELPSSTLLKSLKAKLVQIGMSDTEALIVTALVLSVSIPSEDTAKILSEEGIEVLTRVSSVKHYFDLEEIRQEAGINGEEDVEEEFEEGEY